MNLAFVYLLGVSQPWHFSRFLPSVECVFSSFHLIAAWYFKLGLHHNLHVRCSGSFLIYSIASVPTRCLLKGQRQVSFLSGKRVLSSDSLFLVGWLVGLTSFGIQFLTPGIHGVRVSFLIIWFEDMVMPWRRWQSAWEAWWSYWGTVFISFRDLEIAAPDLHPQCVDFISWACGHQVSVALWVHKAS